MHSNIFVKTQMVELNGERKEKRLGGTFCGILYSSEIPAVKQLDTQLICSNIFEAEGQEDGGEAEAEKDSVMPLYSSKISAIKQLDTPLMREEPSVAPFTTARWLKISIRYSVDVLQHIC
jgi:hypothetical protein